MIVYLWAYGRRKTAEVVRAFLQKEAMRRTHRYDAAEGGILAAWNIRGFPTVFVLDSEGMIRYKDVQHEALDRAVDELMKQAEWRRSGGASIKGRTGVIMRHRGSLRSVIAWLGGLDLILLLAVLAMVTGVWSFIAIADKVVEGRTRRIDEQLIRSLRDPADPSHLIGPDWLEEVGRDLTALGGVAVLGVVTVAVVGFLLIRRTYHAVGFVLIATVGGLVLSLLLKRSFARPRPELVPHLSAVYTSSFPSGHSMLSAVVYLTMGALLARLVEGPAHKVYFLLVAMLLTLLVGVSRVYMGVHYPSDVLAGWSVGLSWAILCWLAARRLQRQGVVERSVE